MALCIKANLFPEFDVSGYAWYIFNHQSRSLSTTQAVTDTCLDSAVVPYPHTYPWNLLFHSPLRLLRTIWARRVFLFMLLYIKKCADLNYPALLWGTKVMRGKIALSVNFFMIRRYSPTRWLNEKRNNNNNVANFPNYIAKSFSPLKKTGSNIQLKVQRRLSGWLIRVLDVRLCGRKDSFIYLFTLFFNLLCGDQMFFYWMNME